MSVDSNPRYLVGAYASSPCANEWIPNLEDEYYEKLASLSNVRGFEVPIHKEGKLHKSDVTWFTKMLSKYTDRNWQFVLTSIPGQMENLKDDPTFGLASNNSEGRQRAVEWMKKMRDCVLLLNQSYAANSVIGIQIHSAPKQSESVSSSKEAFVESLKEITSWEWPERMLITIEHCDTYNPFQAGSKQFLSLEDEIWSLQHVQGKGITLGLTINWGRSCLEGRSVDTPLHHINTVKKSSVPLCGLMFSGCSNKEDPVYGCWLDNHTPFNVSLNSQCSMMDAEQAKKALKAAEWKKLNYFGVKIFPQPIQLTVPQRIQFVQDGLNILADATRV